MQNDLISRSHVGDMFNHADDMEEYNDWIDSQESCDLETIPTSTPEFDGEVEQIENAISETIARQCRIAEKKGMTLDQYREDLIERRDDLLLDLQFARTMARK